jgi:hypothetical protein
MTLAGASLFYESLSILIYTGLFFSSLTCSLCCTRSRLCEELSAMNTKPIVGAPRGGGRREVRSRKEKDETQKQKMPNAE